MKQELTQKQLDIIIDLLKKEVDAMQLIQEIYDFKTPAVKERIKELNRIIEKL